MTECRHEGPPTAAYGRVLWVVLLTNAAMFVVEMTAGVIGQSVALQADAVDFLGDAATYAITLMVLGAGIRWRARAALVKGASMGVFGLWVLGNSVYHVMFPAEPDAVLMGGVGTLALAANIFAALMLFAYRDGDSNMRSVWLCSRNDAIANLAVIAAASGVWATTSPWPDVAVGFAIAGLNVSAAAHVIRRAVGELAAAMPEPGPPEGAPSSPD
ncbi:MAG: cation transporter [Rhodospirillales bacterium]|jgi:Co/Zn/Cd efflux system component|nr:cation transporter [Rhodospirillales bacterium]